MDSELPLALKSFLKRHRLASPIVVGGRNLKRLAAYLRLTSVRAASLLTRRRMIARYLSTHHVCMLQIGAGMNVLSGWLNADLEPLRPGVIYMDAAGRFPFPDRSLDYIFSEHLIEHLPYEGGLNMLRESFRVLKPGGRIRIVTPDLEFYLSLFAADRSEFQERYLRWATRAYLPQVEIIHPTFLLNHQARFWGHQFLYDRETLRRSMSDAGFADPSCHGANETDEPAFKGLECHTEASWLPENLRAEGKEMVALETMALEATRPPR
jgi:predicted SAM-dependent methyltransferase